MQPESNQSARLHETNKTNNFETLEDITIVNLKFRPIIYETGTFTPVCLKLLKQKIVEKTTECTFKFNSMSSKQVNGFPIGRPLFATFSDIYMVKMETNVIIPSKSIFYRRSVDDIYGR